MTADLDVARSVPAEPTPAGRRSLVLVGLMGAGKTSVGRRLAATLDVPFRDADWEIESAAGLKVADIFETYGEPAFRDLERRVVARLLGEGPQVLALGGGAFVDAATRAAVAAHGRAVWLRAQPETLARRAARRRADRPLLRDTDPLETLQRLAAERAPAYGEADIVVDSDGKSVQRVVGELLDALDGWRP